MGDHVPDGSDECATDPALTTQDRRWRRGSGGIRPVDEGSVTDDGGIERHEGHVDASQGGLLGRRGVDRLEQFGDLVPVLAGGIVERVPQQVNHAT